MVSGDKEPIYDFTLEDLGRYNEQPVRAVLCLSVLECTACTAWLQRAAGAYSIVIVCWLLHRRGACGMGHYNKQPMRSMLRSCAASTCFVCLYCIDAIRCPSMARQRGSNRAPGATD